MSEFRSTQPGTRSNLSPPLDSGDWLHAIIDSSEYAILSKTLDGIITTWNPGATRLFGFTAAEAIGQPVTIVIPRDRLYEEDDILRRLRRGERVEQFETIRRRKNGELINISLSATPIQNSAGEILGASKMARDISAEKTAKQQQELLLLEMKHRIKNLFAVSVSLVQVSARSAQTVAEFGRDLTERLMALSRAHDLTLPVGQTDHQTSTSLLAFLGAILSPHAAGHSRISVKGSDLIIGENALTPMALIFHELATNSAKYGALTAAQGELSVVAETAGGILSLHWVERGGPAMKSEPQSSGFGTVLEQASLRSLQGSIRRSWTDQCLTIELRVPVLSLLSDPPSAGSKLNDEL